MPWFSRNEIENKPADPTRVWALVFEDDEKKDADLHLPRYLYFAKQKPKKWNRIRWRDLVTGSCIVEMGLRLRMVTARPPSSLEVSASDYAVGDPSGSCLIASTAKIPIPLRTVYLGVVEYESAEYGCAIVRLDAKYAPCELAGERVTGTVFDIDREWLAGQAIPSQSGFDKYFRIQKAGKSNKTSNREYSVDIMGDSLIPRSEKFRGSLSIWAQDRGALVLSGENRAIGIALGLIELEDDPIYMRKVLQILPFDKAFWRDVVPHVSHMGLHSPVYEVWMGMKIEGWR
ncbi:hypothetical protein F5Y13DRAFT_201051 [Hypoxylon sp. FL1857]|nr:hypothetical protein F5Y13DRAFT_201051 [Hypoxylon sp. FL1857]